MTIRWRAPLAAACVAAAVVPLAPAPAHGATCERAVSISPQVSAGEGAGTLVFRVYSTGCAAAGDVAYAAAPGSATPGTASPADFALPGGALHWAAGDMGTRSITATIMVDTFGEGALEDFTVQLTALTPSVRVASGSAQGRILDDDVPQPAAVIDDALCPKSTIVYCPCVQTMPKHFVCSMWMKPVPPPPPPLPPLTARWETMDVGSAVAGTDYIAVDNQVVTMPAGATGVALPVEILSRPPGTPTRHFYVRIFDVSAGAMADSIAVITILGS